MTRPAFCTPYAPHVLALAHTSPPSACHCEPVRTPVAIRVPAEMPGKLAPLRANSQPLSYSPKVLLSAMPCRRSADCHVASLLAMTVGEVLAPVDTPCLLHTLRAPRPCTRAHVPAFCMSLRTSAHTGVAIRFPAEMPGKLAPLRANPQPLSYSPKVLLSAMPCRKENGLPRRFAPRNDRGGASLRTGARWEPGRTCAARRRRCSGVT